MYKVLIIIEAVNNGLYATVESFDGRHEALKAAEVINNNGYAVEGQSVRAICLFY